MSRQVSVKLEIGLSTSKCCFLRALWSSNSYIIISFCFDVCTDLRFWESVACLAITKDVLLSIELFWGLVLEWTITQVKQYYFLLQCNNWCNIPPNELVRTIKVICLPLSPLTILFLYATLYFGHQFSETFLHTFPVSSQCIHYLE